MPGATSRVLATARAHRSRSRTSNERLVNREALAQARASPRSYQQLSDGKLGVHLEWQRRERDDLRVAAEHERCGTTGGPARPGRRREDHILRPQVTREEARSPR